MGHSVLDAGYNAKSNNALSCGVLFVIDQLCELGGAERILLRIVRQLPRDRFSPRIVTFKIDESLPVRDMAQCPIHVIPLSRTYDWNAFRVARQIRQIIRARRIQITHTFHETSDLWGGMIAKLSGCPVLISSRRDMGFQRRPKHHLAYRWLGKHFDEVQVVSEEVRRFCIEQDRLDPQRVVTIYNGVDLPRHEESESKAYLRQRFGLPAERPLVVSVGHIRKIKGFDVYMRAAARVRAVMPQVTFAVAGCDHEPDHTRDLTALTAELGLGSNFLFLGNIEDIPSLLRAADIFCLPSRSEGLSNALLEAMAAGLPCVASRVGGNPELVTDGQTGYLFASEDDESAAECLLRLLTQPVKARRMGEAGRAVAVEKFTTEAMMARLIDSYERLLSFHGECI